MSKIRPFFAPRTPAITLLALNLLAAFAPVRAVTITVPVGTVVTRSTPLYLGFDSLSDDTLNVLSDGTQWVSSSLLYIGGRGTGTLVIAGGGVARSAWSMLGDTSSGNGTVSVIGAGSQWTISEDLFIGNSGTGLLNIWIGGVVRNTRGVVGDDPGGKGTVNVTDAGSQWIMSEDLVVGHDGKGALNITNSGVVTNRSGTIGFYSLQSNTVSVTGTGSQWNNSGDLTVGYAAKGALRIADKGVVRSTRGLLGATFYGNGTVNVIGAGSQWTMSEELIVGDVGSGVLNMFDAGQVTATALSIGAKGIVKLDGGSLQIASGTIEAGGSFNWLSGTLIHTGSAQLGAGLLIGKPALNPGQTLQIGNGGTEGDLVGHVLNNGTLAFHRADASSFAGNIAGSGALIKSGAGTLSLAGINSYTGATTINGGTLAFTNAGNQTLSGAVTGSGALTKSGSGTLTLAGSNSYSGATAINGGTLAFTSAGNQTLSGVVTGSGVLAKSGAGTLTLSADNSQTGATQIGAGTLLLSGQSRSGSFEMASGAVLELNVASGTRDGAVNTQFIGNGSLRKTGAGESVWTGSSATFAMGVGSLIDIQGGRFNGGSFGNEDWRLNKSQLRVAAGATFAGTEANVRVDGIDGAGRITSGFGGAGYTSFTMGVANGSGNFSGVLADTNAANGHIGSYVKAGSGTQILSGENTYTGGTTISGGVLQIGNGGSSGAIVGNVLNNGTLAFNRSDATSFAGVISGSGSLQKLGAGTLTLSAGNTYTGSTDVSAGTLVLSGQNRSGSFNVASGAVLELNVATNSRDGAVNTEFTGQGTLRKTGTGSALWMASQAKFAMAAGSLIDVRAGSFLGGFGNEDWLLNQSGLNVAAGASFVGIEANVRVDALTGGGRISSGFNGAGYTAFTIGVANGSGEFSGVLADSSASGRGHFVKEGTGTQTLSGTNTYTGGTTITAGALQIGNGGTSGAIVGNVANNALLLFNRSDDLAFAGVVSGSGGLGKLGSGTLTLSAANTYSGGTALSGGVLAVASDANLGSGGLSFAGGTLRNTGAIVTARQVTLGSGGGVFDTAGGYLTINSNVGGTGGLAKTGGDILTLAGAQGYTGTTVISAGTLKFAASGATASSVASTSIAIGSGARLIFADTQNYAGAVTGAGLLMHEFGGTTTLTGAAAHSGGTAVVGGTIQVGNGGTTGTLAGNVALSGGGTLAFNRSDAMGFAGAITGAGGVAQRGTGVLTLSGVNTYSGSTSVEAGSLQLAAALTGTQEIRVAAGASLLTSAAVTQVALGANGANSATGGSLLMNGTLAVGGASAGVLQLALGSGGTLAFGQASVLEFDLGTAQDLISFDATSAWLSGSGLATLALDVANPGFDYSKTYTVFHGVQASGFTFASMTGYDRLNYQAKLFQSGDDLNIRFSPAAAVPEPGTWALLLAGLGLMGRAVRRREAASSRTRA